MIFKIIYLNWIMWFILKCLKRINASSMPVVIMFFLFIPRFVCLWIWAADFQSANRWGCQTNQPSFQFPVPRARTQPTANPKAMPQPQTEPLRETVADGKRERETGKGNRAETSWIVIMQTNYMAGKIRYCAAGIVNVFADIWMCYVFAAICTVYCVLCVLCTLCCVARVIIIWQFWLVVELGRRSLCLRRK